MEFMYKGSRYTLDTNQPQGMCRVYVYGTASNWQVYDDRCDISDAHEWAKRWLDKNVVSGRFI
jgi:hypothetical protein